MQFFWVLEDCAGEIAVVVAAEAGRQQPHGGCRGWAPAWAAEFFPLGGPDWNWLIRTIVIKQSSFEKSHVRGPD